MYETPIFRRQFLGSLGMAGLGTMLGTEIVTHVLGQEATQSQKKWEPVSDRKIRFGIVGYGVCKFGAQFGFQNHPNVEVVAVSDLIPQRRTGLMKACQCDKSYESLEELVKDPRIEAVFVATDAPSHPRHCIEVLTHGKHVMTAVPATFGSIEMGEKVLETVQSTGLKYMMAETSCFRPDCYAMRRSIALEVSDASSTRKESTSITHPLPSTHSRVGASVALHSGIPRTPRRITWG